MAAEPENIIPSVLHPLLSSSSSPTKPPNKHKQVNSNNSINNILKVMALLRALPTSRATTPTTNSHGRKNLLGIYNHHHHLHCFLSLHPPRPTPSTGLLLHPRRHSLIPRAVDSTQPSSSSAGQPLVADDEFTLAKVMPKNIKIIMKETKRERERCSLLGSFKMK